MDGKNATLNGLDVLVRSMIKKPLGLLEEHKIITAIIDDRNPTRPFSHMDVVALPKKGIQRGVGMMIGENQGLVFEHVRYGLFDAICNTQKMHPSDQKGHPSDRKGHPSIGALKKYCIYLSLPL